MEKTVHVAFVAHHMICICATPERAKQECENYIKRNFAEPSWTWTLTSAGYQGTCKTRLIKIDMRVETYAVLE